MKNLHWQIWLLLILGMGSTLELMAQTLPCGTEDFYLIMNPSITKNSELYRVVMDREQEEASFQRIAKLDRQIDAAGYRVTDGYIYGLDRNTYELIRIYGDGHSESLGRPQDLDTTFQYFAGTINPLGHHMFVIGRNPFTGLDEKIFRISLNSPVLITSPSNIDASARVRIDDIAFDPVYGTMMGFNALDQRLVQVSTSGQISDFNYLNTAQSSGMGSILFDPRGQMYGFGYPVSGSVETTLFEINKFNGNVQVYDKGPGKVWSDGCGCPYYVDLKKRIEPQAVLPCGEVKIVYTFENHGGSSFSTASFTDTLPPYLSIQEVERLKFSYDTLTGLGSHVFHIERPAFYLGLDSVILRAVVDEGAKGAYRSQARLNSLPLMLGGEILSDDPLTAASDDPTSLRFLPQGKLALQSQLLVLCPGETATLKAPGGGLRYLWNDGSTGEELTIDQGGWYWLEVENECGLFRDSLFVADRQEPLMLDLGPDLLISPGDSVWLAPQTLNAVGNLQYLWSAVGIETLSCDNCPQLPVQPQKRSRYRLKVTDQEGCSAIDSVTIDLKKFRKIYSPTAFSPNQDQINDVFFLQGFGEVELLSLRVFNRWGRVIFLREGGWINDERHGWDGRTPRGYASGGVYVWQAQLRFPDGEVETFSGSLTLIR
jgi:gliding motility-associated-like protein